MKRIHTADIHLNSPLHRLEAYEGAPVEKIRQASRRALENLIDLALDAAADFVMIAGDLFDGDWKDYHTGLYFISQVRRLCDAHIPVFIVAGNHDAAGQMTRSLPYPDQVHLFSAAKRETRILDAPKVAIHDQSFAIAAVMDNMLYVFAALPLRKISFGNSLSPLSKGYSTLTENCCMFALRIYGQFLG